jgi:hypothetical protein
MELGEIVWDEFWENLHHQGDLGEAAYAALPHLVRISERIGTNWNLYALAATIEIERHRKTNPSCPDWAEAPYSQAWSKLVMLALRDLANARDPLLIRSALAVVALGRGDLKLGSVLSYMDDSELTEYADDRLSWSVLYDA